MQNNAINHHEFLGLYKTEYHSEVIRRAYGDKIQANYLNWLIHYDSRVDIVYSLSGQYHYDNNDLAAGDTQIQNSFESIKNINSNPLNFIKILDALNVDNFAAITHATADYYAHTNVVERNIDPSVSGQTPLLSGHFSLLDHSLNRNDATSYWEIIHSIQYSLDQYSPINNLINYNNLTYFTHSQINKDAPDTPEGSVLVNNRTLHDISKSMAIDALTNRLERFKEVAPCIWLHIQQ